MDLCFESRSHFIICGYCVETSLETCEKDLSQLWKDFNAKKTDLFDLFGYRKDFYGLMWKTHGSHYCYLIGIQVDSIDLAPEGACYKSIPAAYYAVASVPPSVSAVEAWTQYYEKILPGAGYVPNAGHGFDFEYYPNGGQGIYEMWTPVEKIC